ncbi:MAG: choice-of-anchor R domain-containing protein [Bacillota bacterium]
MTIWGFKNDLSVLDEATLNAIISAQNSVLLFDGTQADAHTGAGVTDNDISNNSYIARFTLTGQTTIGRAELNLSKTGVGANIVLEIRDNTFNPNGTNDGMLLKSMVFPAKLFPTAATYTSLPVDLSGLTAGATYWLRVNKAGDATNRMLWRGEATINASYPTYFRSGLSGAWTANNALHFRVFANTPGTYLLRHGVWGTNGQTLVLYGGSNNISEIWRWLPANDGVFVICDKLTPTYDANGVPVRWGVS